MSKDQNQPAEKRDQWGHQIEFFLTLVGYAVGLGNVWRFPYLCFRNGGGAFLVPYVICLIVVGIPLFALEVSLGQFGGKGPITVWYINPAFKGVGMAAVLVTTIIQIYYGVVIAWGAFYLFASMASTLPWRDCKTCECFLYEAEAALRATNLSASDRREGVLYHAFNASGLNCSTFDGNPKSPSELYFVNEVLHRSSSIREMGNIQWQLLLCNLLGWVLTFLVLCKGIQSLGKVVYFTATIPYIILTVLLVRGVLMAGAMDGIEFYLLPDFSRLLDANVWSDAAVQVFFSLGACQGGLIAMSSYNKFNKNVLRDALTVPIINCLTSIFAGFVVFSVLGNIALLENTSVANVTKGGPGLAFMAYPSALAKMPIAPLWAVLFFILFCILGFCSQFSFVETTITSVFDEFPRFFNINRRKYAFRAAWCVVGFILGIPMVSQGGFYLLNLVDNAILGFPSLVVGLFELVGVMWIYGIKKFSKDVEIMVGFRPLIFWPCWIVISPVLIFMVIISAAIQHTPRNVKYGEPLWAEALYWLIILTPIMCIPVWFIIHAVRNGGLVSIQKMADLCISKPAWSMRRLKGDVFDKNGMNYTKDNYPPDETEDRLYNVQEEDETRMIGKHGFGDALV